MPKTIVVTSATRRPSARPAAGAVSASLASQPSKLYTKTWPAFAIR